MTLLSAKFVTRFFMVTIACVAVGFVTVSVAAKAADISVLRFGYGPYQSPPIVQEQDRKLVGGHMYVLGQRLAGQIGVKILYIPVPRKRLLAALEEGTIDLRCHLSPSWMPASAKVIWSPPLYRLRTVLFGRKDRIADVKALEDLAGHRVGAVLGFRYGPGLTAMFDSGRIYRTEAGDVARLLRMMKLGRVDYVPGTERLGLYLLDSLAMSEEYGVTPWAIREQDIRCAISPKSRIPVEKLLQALESLPGNASFLVPAN